MHPYKAELDMSDIEKGTYPHYMLKEMDEQPAVIRKIIQAYQNEQGELTIDPAILDALHEADRLYIIAAGTSYHAGLIGKEYFEKIAGIPVEVHISSEFGYNMPLLSEKPLFMFITQSGETADSRQVLVKIKELGYPTITMTNVPGSTLSREADHTLIITRRSGNCCCFYKSICCTSSSINGYRFMFTHNLKDKTLDFDL